jgi:hypothetical protein
VFGKSERSFAFCELVVVTRVGNKLIYQFAVLVLVSRFATRCLAIIRLTSGKSNYQKPLLRAYDSFFTTLLRVFKPTTV